MYVCVCVVCTCVQGNERDALDLVLFSDSCLCHLASTLLDGLRDLAGNALVVRLLLLLLLLLRLRLRRGGLIIVTELKASIVGWLSGTGLVLRSEDAVKVADIHDLI